MRSGLIDNLCDLSNHQQENDEEVIKNAVAISIQLNKDQVKNPKAMLRTAIKEQWHTQVYRKRA